MPDTARAAAPEWPNLRHLRLLEIAARHDSLTQAAGQVNISQPAASQAIAKLGRIFGARLLERCGNAVMPTDEGRIVIARARRALDHLQHPHPGTRSRTRQARADLLERYASVTQLRVMALFAVTGSLSAIAAELGQTEASVQRAVKDIERIIGQPALEGGPRNRVLSAAGQQVATRASLALREIDLAHADLRERAGVFDSRLVIGVLPLARTRIVPRAIVRLQAQYPSATVEVLEGAYDFLLRRLRLGACDMIIGALRSDLAQADLDETPLLRDRLRVVARAGHPLAGRRLDPADLAAARWILPRRDAPARRVFDAMAARHGLLTAGHGHIETGSLVVLRGVLLESDALTLISPNQISYEIEQGLLRVLDVPLDGGERDIGIAQLQGNMPGQLRSRFIALIAEEAIDIGCENSTDDRL